MFRSACGMLLLTACVLCMAEEPQPPPLGPRIERLRQVLEELEASENDLLARKLRQELDQAIVEAEDDLFPARRARALTKAEYEFLVSHGKKWLDKLSDISEDDNGRAAVESFTDEFKDLQDSWADGTAYLPPSDEPIVQWLHAGKANPDVSGDGSNNAGDEQGGLSDVSIRLGDLKRETILVLSSDVSASWKLEGDDALVKAVVLFDTGSRFSSRDDLLVFRVPMNGSLRDRYDNYARLVKDQLGRSADLVLTIHDFSQPFAPSPRNPDWARACVIGQLRQLSNRIKREANRAFATAHGDLRFPGFTVETRSFQRASSLTEFGLTGPTSGERRPMQMKTPRELIGLNTWNYTAVGDEAFALTFHGQLSRRGSSDSDWIKVESPPGMDRPEFRQIALDTKRNRLVLLDAKGNLRAFDPTDLDDPKREGGSRWSFLCKGMGELFGIVYQPSTDQIVAIRQRPHAAPFVEKLTSLLFLDSNGKISRHTDSDCTTAIQNVVERTYNEMHLTDDYLIATQPPATSRRHPLRNVIRVFELQTGKLVYDYMLPATNSTEDGPARRAMQNEIYTYARFQERLRNARLSIEKAKSHDPAAADKLGKQWDSLANPLAHASRPRAKPVIYWVRTFGNRAPVVKVTDTSGPVVLAISSFNIAEWRFELDEGVNIREVVFVGRKVPKLIGLPVDVKVTKSTEDLQGNERQADYQRSVILKQLPGVKFAAEVMIQPYDRSNELVLGPSNVNESVGKAIHDLDELALVAGRLSGNSAISEDYRFAYAYQRKKDGEFYVAECDFRGPILQTQRRLDISMPTWNAVAYAGPGRMFVGSTTRVDELSRTDKSYGVVPFTEFPQVRSQHLVFGAATNRLFRIDVGNRANLHIHNQGNAEATTVAIDPFESRLSNRVAWCHDSARKRFFAVVRTQMDITGIHEFNESGRLTRKLRLPTPISARLHPGDQFFSAFCDLKNIIIVMRGRLGINGTKVHVLDLQSLKTVYRGDFQPHVLREDLSYGKFARLWDELTDADEDEADAIMWQLAAGGQDTMKRVQVVTGGAESEGLTVEQVDALVKQLDADRYAERRSAFEQLRLGAVKQAEYIRGLDRKQLTAEQRYRVERLLKDWSAVNSPRDYAQEIIKRINEQ